MRTLCMYIILLLCLSSCKPSFNLTDQFFKHGAEYTVPINLSNISSRFDSDFYHKNKDIIDSIINFTNLNTNHVIEIGVYTTYLGQEEYNLKLSLAQAKGFIFILKSNGARHENLIPVGYGEKNLIYNEKKINKMNVNEQKIAHKKNGRIILKILN